MSVYSAREAADYDTRSTFDKGDRDLHRHYVADLVRHLKPDLSSFVELGCGTAFFAEAVLGAAPEARGLLVDGSEPMLELAKRRLVSDAHRVSFLAGQVDDVRFDPPFDNVDLIICALTLHLVGPEVRARALRQAFAALAPQGILILIDHFVPGSSRHAELLEYLACRDVQRRMQAAFGPALAGSRQMQIEEIIRRDRERDAREGAAHLDVEDIRAMVASAGFGENGILFQDARFFGLVAYKDGTA